ncbi:FmdE family protein [Thermodesulforhabdus norvegica]|uniref:FmdE, Molybdenum formylmethanofuran dehydrogenase operon n=1 Tax=Thermodesulforhabdus norvegica TaxID=39841 RepID=A0A1I4S7T6_9BACT|nr:FmdE family protein [Thermodesulforhabdus norvegica]SFM60562.1 FmdE, Molybdenum formylmethanofuran dehydrogenase operon [Thermodesulforhabdus norvegica]
MRGKSFVPAILLIFALLLGPHRAFAGVGSYNTWYDRGKLIASFSLDYFRSLGFSPVPEDLVLITNAAYAQIYGESTHAVVDGFSDVLGVKRGKGSLIEVHSSSWAPLWSALFDKKSGYCVYIELAEGSGANHLTIKISAERIDADYVISHVGEWTEKQANKVFGGNEFRIISIANAVAEGAPELAVRAFEFHDHYCPGVTSGIIMALYLLEHFPPRNGSGYFIHGVDPWCKEDAFLTILNATPGKKQYAVYYPSDDDRAQRTDEGRDASTIAYRQREDGSWEGVVLSFSWGDPTCPGSGRSLDRMLCMDLWYLDRLDRPEEFVKVIKQFELPSGITPQDWARPGVDPLKELGLAR